MSTEKRMSLVAFQEHFGTEQQCRDYLVEKRWPTGFVCPKCGATAHCKLSNGMIQCGTCRHQTSVTAGTIMHRTHVPLTKWFLALYFTSQDKRGISAVQLKSTIGVSYKTAWYLLARIREAMGQRDDTHQLKGIVEFDDAFFGGPTVGKKRGRGTEKSKVFVALSLDKKENPLFLKMKVTKDIRQASVRRFAEENISAGSIVRSDGYRSYEAALKNYQHEPKVYNPNSGLLHWLHITIRNAKAFIQGTYHGLPSKNLSAYLDEYCFRFSRRSFGGGLLERLAVAMVRSSLADLKG